MFDLSIIDLLHRSITPSRWPIKFMCETDSLFFLLSLSLDWIQCECIFMVCLQFGVLSYSMRQQARSAVAITLRSMCGPIAYTHTARTNNEYSGFVTSIDLVWFVFFLILCASFIARECLPLQGMEYLPDWVDFYRPSVRPFRINSKLRLVATPIYYKLDSDQ